MKVQYKPDNTTSSNLSSEINRLNIYNTRFNLPVKPQYNTAMKNIGIVLGFICLILSFNVNVFAQDRALDFDGIDDAVNLGNDASFEVGAGFTFEAWIKIDAYKPASSFLFNKWEATNVEDNYVSISNTGTVNLLLKSSPIMIVSTTDIVPLNQWTHIAATFDQTLGGKIYINGVEKAFTAGTDPVANNGGFLYLASNPSRVGTELPFDGQMDELRLWNTARTQAEIETNLNLSLTTGTGLVASYDFDQVSGDLLDISPAPAKNGTVSGALYVISTAIETDVTAPLFEAATPSISNIFPDGFDLNLQINEDGDVHYIVVDAGETAPSSAEVKTGEDYFATVVHASGTVSLLTSSPTIESIFLLQPSTAYDVYLVAEDAALNLQTTPTFLSVTTNAPPPLAPSELIAFKTSATDITLNWTDNATNETGYLLERADDSEFTINVTLIDNTIAADASSYVFGAGASQGYYFRLTATNGAEDYTSQSLVEYGTTVVPPGNALNFDGTDDIVDIGSYTIIKPSTAFTLEAWFNSTSFASQPSIIRARDNVSQYSGYNIGFGADGTVSYLATTTGSSWDISLASDAPIPTGEWHHIAVSMGGGQTLMYIDGVLQANTAGSGTLVYNAGSVYIGGDSDGFYWNGDLDEVRIWDDVRTSTEIQDNMYYTLQGNEANLVAYYSFDQAITNTYFLPDRSINTNDGTWYDTDLGSNTAPNWVISGALTDTAPTDITLDNLSIIENVEAGISIGTFTTTDAEQSAFTYSFATGDGLNDANNADFFISGDQLLTSTPIDFEVQSSYNIFVQTDDGAGGIFQKAFVITVIDIDEVAPTVLSVTPSTINITDAEVGTGTFSIVVNYSEAMDPAFFPSMLFSPDVSAALTIAGGSFSTTTFTNDTYTATYDVADANANVIGVGITVNGGQDLAANVPPSSDYLDAFDITMAPPSITVFSPNGGENVIANTLYPLTWIEAGVVASDNIEISLSTDGGSTFALQASGTADSFNGFYSWTVPEQEGTTNIIRVVNTTQGFSDDSDAVFSISVIILTNPALLFDGIDDYVEVNSFTAPVGDLTLEAWVYYTGDGSAPFETILEFFNDSPWLGIQNGKLTAYLAGGDAINFPQTTWKHVALTYNATAQTINLYIDGIAVATNLDATSLGLPFSGTNLLIGGGGSGSTEVFTGIIDEVRIWGVERSQAEIDDNRNTQLIGNENGLISYYPLIGGAGTTSIIDAVEANGTGALSNMDVSTVWVEGPPLSLPGGNSNPVITSLSTVSVDEGLLTVQTVTFTDADAGDTHTFSIIGGDDSALFAIDVSTGEITFNAAPDFENPADVGTDNVYNITIEVADQAGGTDDLAVIITVLNLNDNVPVIDQNTPLSVDEASSAIISSLELTTTDEDNTPSELIYNIIVPLSNGFVVNTNDVETSITTFTQADIDGNTIAYVHDGSETTSDTFVFSVNDGAQAPPSESFNIVILPVNNKTPIITPSGPFSIDENTAVSTVAATITATDGDSGATTYSWSIVSGNTDINADANPPFIINLITGEIVVNDADDLNFELVASFTLGISVSDGVNTSAVENVVINLNNLNDTAPIEDANSGLLLDEGAGEVITSSNLSFSDQDNTAEELVYTITTAPNNGIVAHIEDLASAITSFSQADLAANFIYYVHDGSETLSDSFTFEITDGLFTISGQTFNITVNAVNNISPVITPEGPFNVDENTSGTIATLTATDGDSGATTFSNWTIVLGNADMDSDTNPAFAINPSTGELSINDPDDLDFEAITNFTLGITVTDGTNISAVENIVIDINDVDEVLPIVTAVAPSSSLTDAEVGLSTFSIDVTYSESMNSGILPNISFAQGLSSILTFASGAFSTTTFTNDVYTATYDVADGNLDIIGVDITVTGGADLAGNTPLPNNTNDAFDITMANQAPIITSSSAVNVDEGLLTVQTVTFTDADAGDTHTFSIAGGDDAALFSINASTGELTFNAAPDFENPVDLGTDNIYDVTVQVTDQAGGLDTQAQIITITDTNDTAPTITNAGSFNIDENSNIGASLVTMLVTDPDTNNVFAWSLTTGNIDVDADSNLPFVIEASTGEITVNDADDLDFESGTTSFTIQVVVSDGVNTTGQAISINLNDVNDNAPVIVSQSPININETFPNGTLFTTITANDADASSTFTWSIIGGNTDHNANAILPFAINSTNGQLTINDTGDIDFESGNISFTLEVGVSDGVNSASESFILNVVDNFDESPVIITSTSLSLDENTTTVTTLTVSDTDAGDSPSYSLSGGADQSFFSIGNTSGDLTFNLAPNFEVPSDLNADNVYEVEITVTDLGGNTTIDLFSITVLDVTEDPVALAASNVGSFSFDANWEPLSGAISYELDVSESASFDDFVMGYQGLIVNTTTQVVDGLYHGITYYYRVRALVGEVTNYSNTILVLLPISEALVSDSTALVNIYNATSGASWTSNAEWLTGNVKDWFGITFSEGITNIDLSNNNLQGTLPALGEVGFASLTTVDFSNNGLTAVSDYSHLPSIVSVNIANNDLDFTTLESIVDLSKYQISPQNEQLTLDFILQTQGEAIALDRTIGGTSNTYKWYKDNAEIAGETNATLTIADPQPSSEGSYHVEVTNEAVSGLTISTLAIDLKVSSLERDSLSLVAFYDALDGDSWTDKSGWDSGNRGALSTWTGVGFDGGNTRIISISLPSNKLNGDLPQEITDIENLETLDLSGNGIASLPDITSLSSLTSVDVSSNQLHFDDLELNIELTGFVFANQANVGETIEQDLSRGTDLTLSVIVGGLNNAYQWFLDDNAIAGANSDTYELLSIGFNNMGTYRCEVSNSVVSTTINSNKQTYYAVVDLSGKVIDTESLEVNEGVIRLLEISKEANVQFDTVAVVSVGVNGYLIENVRLADYIISVEGDLEKYLPSYYINTIEWTKADTLFLRDHTDQLNINIENIPAPLDENDGNGRTFGVLEEEIPDAGRGRILGRRRIGGAGISMRRRIATGRGEDEFEILAYVKTNGQGEFDIDFLPAGYYKFSIELPGIPVDTTSFTSFTIGANGVEDNTFELSAVVIEGGIVVEKIIETGFYRDYFKNLTIYPNPAKNQLTIQYDKLLTAGVMVQIIDLTGNILLERTLGNGYSKSIGLDVSSLSEGLYIMNFIDPNKGNLNITAKKVMIKR